MIGSTNCKSRPGPPDLAEAAPFIAKFLGSSTQAEGAVRFRPRFGVRWLMIAVAIAATITSAEVMRRRRMMFLEKAAQWAALERRFLRRVDEDEADAELCRDLARGADKRAEFLSRTFGKQSREAEQARAFAKANRRDVESLSRDIGIERAISSHARRMAAKYEHAARHPWLHVEPDSPDPM